jgi:hypothetical protein
LAVDIEITVEIANARASVPTRIVLSGTSTVVTPTLGQRVVSTPIP